MPRGDQSAHADKQKRQSDAIEKAQEPNGSARPEAGARAWPTVNKIQSGAKQIASRRKVPSGPVGGSGRKTNLSRSS